MYLSVEALGSIPSTAEKRMIKLLISLLLCKEKLQRALEPGETGWHTRRCSQGPELT